MSDRLKRKDIKRNELVEGLDLVVDFIQRNARNLIMAAVAIVVLAIGIVVYSSVQRGRANEVNTLLAEALDTASAPVGDAATAASKLSFASEAERTARSKELFEQIDGRGTAPAQVASAFLGDLAASSGNLDEAREHWQGLVKKDRKSLLAAAVETNLLALDRAQGRGEEALGRIQGWLESAKTTPLPQDVLLRELGATFESLGRSNEAQQTYQRLVDEHPNSAYVSEVRSKINS